jgi:UPF0755 protein
MNDDATENARKYGRTNAPIVPKTVSEALMPKEGTPPPKRSRHARNRFVVFLNFVVSFTLLLAIAAGLAFFYGSREFNGPGPAPVATSFMVKKNAGLREIAQQLENQGLITDSRIFSIGVRADGNETALRSGEYSIKAHASMREIMELMKSGKSVLYSLTIPEGLTVAQAFERIAEDEVLIGPMPDEMPPEGSLVTDTQRFSRGTTRREIVDKMIADQEQIVESIWEKRDPDLPIKNVNEFVTLASIVEKETGVADERPQVAAVFINRLKKGMRLQSDPTIIYGLFGGKGKPPDRPLYQSDIDKATPYNTYTIDGLPPAPIANPGRAALEAVANPAKTDALYFVADGSGGHVFSATLKEHNENVKRWRQIEKERQEAADNAAKENSPSNNDPGGGIEKQDGSTEAPQ